MRVLAVTNMYPTAERPTSGVFVEQQVEGLRRHGVEVEVLLVDRRKDGMASYFRMARPLTSAIQRFTPDVVHAMYGGLLAWQTTRLGQGQRTVITFHGSDLLGENLSGRLRWLLSHVGVVCSKRAALRACAVAIVSNHLRTALPAGLRPDRVRVIPCGIDLERFRPLDQTTCRRQLGWRDGVFHIVFADNNLDPVKRPDLARLAVGALAQHGVACELHYLHGVLNTDVPVWLNAGDTLLLTSLHEGSPTVVKEALACNLPVVSVDVGDVAERMAGIEGCYLAVADPEKLAVGLRMVHQRARRLADGRQAMQDLSLPAIAANLVALYEDVLVAEPLGRLSHS